jgi:hypothetical protein
LWGGGGHGGGGVRTGHPVVVVLTLAGVDNHGLRDEGSWLAVVVQNTMKMRKKHTRLYFTPRCTGALAVMLECL